MFKQIVAISLLSASCVPGLIGAASAGPADPVWIPVGAGLKPVTLTVVDGKTGDAVRTFSYRYRYAAPGVSHRRDRFWHQAESRLGTVVIPGPLGGRLTVNVDCTDAKPGTDGYHEFVIRSTDRDRRIVVELERGLTVQGVVRDAKTRKPIGGVGLRPDGIRPARARVGKDRGVTSDPDGRFVLHGVDPERGIWATHSGHREIHERNLNGPDVATVDLYLEAQASVILSGTVRDSNGRPLEGVTVSDGMQEVQTARDGTYALRDPITLIAGFDKAGYVSRVLTGSRDIHEYENVVLERQIPLRGRVVGSDGRPVQSFAILSGPGETRENQRYVPCEEQVFRDEGGRFELGLDERARTWIGARAPGYAFGEVWTDAAPNDPEPVIRLETGVVVSGTIKAPSEVAGNIEARLVARRDSNDGRGRSSSGHMKEWSVVRATVTDGRKLRFEHVRPDRYTVHFSGPGVTPRALAIDVPAAGVDLGEIRLAGRGRITGRVFRRADHGGGRGPSPTAGCACRARHHMQNCASFLMRVVGSH